MHQRFPLQNTECCHRSLLVFSFSLPPVPFKSIIILHGYCKGRITIPSIYICHSVANLITAKIMILLKLKSDPITFSLIIWQYLPILLGAKTKLFTIACKTLMIRILHPIPHFRQIDWLLLFCSLNIPDIHWP